MNKKGFTLIEILAVIVILALVTVIVSARNLNILDTAKKKLSEMYTKRVLNKAKEIYTSECIIGLNSTDKCKSSYLTLQDIMGANDKGYAYLEMSNNNGTVSINGVIEDNGYINTIENSTISSSFKPKTLAKLAIFEGDRLVSTTGILSTAPNFLADKDGISRSNITRSNIKRIFFNYIEDENRLPADKWELKTTEDSDNKVYAYIDDTTLYIVSQGIIVLPSNNALFYLYTNLERIVFNNVDTSNMKTMAFMFSYDYHLKEIIGLNKFNTINVTSMNYMFMQCQSIEILDLSSFDTRKLGSMAYMFSFGNVDNPPNIASSLKTIYVSDKFTTNSINENQGCFANCNSLTLGKNNCNDDNEKKYSTVKFAHIHEVDTNPGYFTRK